MQHGELTVYSISLVLSSPPLAALSTSCQPVQQRNNKEKWSPSEARLLLLIYVSISVFIHYPPHACRVPGCGLPFDPTVSSMTIVFPLLTGIRQNIKYIPDRSIFLLWALCVKYWYFLNKRLALYFFPAEHQRNFAHSLFFSAFCPSPYLTMQRLLNITYCLVVFECCCGPPVQVEVGCVFGLLSWAQRRVRSKPASTRCYTALATCLSIPSLSLLLSLSSSTPPPSHPCCLSVSTFPVVVWDMASGCLGCQLLPAHTVTSSPATSAPRANATAGHYWAFILSRLPVPGGESFHVVWTILNSNAYCNGGREHNLFLTKETAPTTGIWQIPIFTWFYWTIFTLMAFFLWMHDSAINFSIL